MMHRVLHQAFALHTFELLALHAMPPLFLRRATASAQERLTVMASVRLALVVNTALRCVAVSAFAYSSPLMRGSIRRCACSAVSDPRPLVSSLLPSPSYFACRNAAHAAYTARDP